MRRSLWLTLLREERSDTAVEFALIGSVLFLMLFAITYMALGQFWQMMLDDSVRTAARQVELRNINPPGSNFAAAVCGEFGLAAPSCASNLGYDVKQAPQFASLTPDSIATLSNSSGFPTGLQPGQAVLFQVVYKVPLNLPLLPIGLMTGNGTGELVSAVALMEQ